MNFTGKFEVDPNDFIKDQSKRVIRDFFGVSSYAIQKQTGKKCFKKIISLNKHKNAFQRSISILSQHRHPAFVPYIGYSSDKKRGSIYCEVVENGSLSEFIKKSTENKNSLWDNTHKLIVSYGISCAMEYLHSHNIVNRDLKSKNILLDSNLYPKLTGFECSVDTTLEFDLESTVRQTSITNMAPEFLNDYIKYNRTKPIDVFSYALVLYEIWTGKIPYSENSNSLNTAKNIMENIRPEFPSDSNINENLINLIKRCWDQNPDKRPTFTEICDLLENDNFVDNIDSELFDSYIQIVRNKSNIPKIN